MPSVQPQTVSPATLFMTLKYSDLDMTDVPVGFQSFFGRTPDSRTDFVNNSLQYTIDIIRGELTISKMLPRIASASWDLGTDTKSLKGQRYKNITRVFPIMQEQGHIAFDDLFERMAGQPQIDNNRDIMDALRPRFGEIMSENMKRLMRRNELACSESIRLGTQTLDNGEAYDFDRSTNNTFAAALVWTNANAGIIEEIDDLCDIIQDNGKADPDFVLPGTDVWAAMVKQLTISTLADNRRYSFITAGNNRILPDLPSNLTWMVTAGFKYVGEVTTFKGRVLPIFIYNKKYQNASGTHTPFMPVDQFTAGWSDARCDRAFGPRITFPNNPFHEQAMNALLGFDFATAQMPAVVSNPGVFDPRMFHIDGRVNDDNDAISARIVTGGVFPTTRTDSFGTITSVV